VIQLKSSISLKLGTNVGFGERIIVAKKVGQNILFLQVRRNPCKNGHLTLNMHI